MPLLCRYHTLKKGSSQEVHRGTYGPFLPAVGTPFLCPWNVGFHPTEDVEFQRQAFLRPSWGWVEAGSGYSAGNPCIWLSPELPAHWHCKCPLPKWADLTPAWGHCLETASWCVPSCVHKQADNVHGDHSQPRDSAAGFLDVPSICSDLPQAMVWSLTLP